MNYRQLHRRIQNLDFLYLEREKFRDAAFAEKDPEARRGLHRLADAFGRGYESLVKDRRRVHPIPPAPTQ